MFGIDENYERKLDSFYFNNLWFPACVHVCEEKRKNDGAWNGMIHRRSDNYCMCIKGDRGHTNDSAFVHYRTIKTDEEQYICNEVHVYVLR